MIMTRLCFCSALMLSVAGIARGAEAVDPTAASVLDICLTGNYTDALKRIEPLGWSQTDQDDTEDTRLSMAYDALGGDKPADPHAGLDQLVKFAAFWKGGKLANGEFGLLETPDMWTCYLKTGSETELGAEISKRYGAPQIDKATRTISYKQWDRPEHWDISLTKYVTKAGGVTFLQIDHIQ